MIHDDFIPLEREFRPIPRNIAESDQYESYVGFGLKKPLTWPNLLDEHRVVILAEAGSGKTAEIRNVARSLRQQGKSAFFLRLESLALHFDAAFEEGSQQEFENWLASDESAWVFLDSVDEARLRDPRDFEAAIRVFGVKARDALQRVHVYVTSRAPAWRPKSDLTFLRAKLPFITPLPVKEAGDADESDLEVEEADPASDAEAEPDNDPFKFYSLAPLTSQQIRKFVTARGVDDPQAFLDAVERADAWSQTSRPFDLDDLIHFWNQNESIGSRLALAKANIDRRLAEIDQNRAEAKPLPLEKARHGARLLAAGVLLLKEQTIRVPDGQMNSIGLDAKTLLVGWRDDEVSTLLSRPIFDDAIYGGVRFRDRETREYLGAEWFHHLLAKESSRDRVEGLLFRDQYGVPVIVPTLRPVIPWLALLDSGIQQRARAIAPEAILEGGDPSQLPLAVRREILRAVCAELATGTSGRSAAEHGAVQRFASPDLAQDVEILLKQYADNHHVTWVLLRLVWLGPIMECLSVAKLFAVDSTKEKYTRVAAIRAVKATGCDSDFRELWDQIVSHEADIDRSLFAELVAALPETPNLIQQLLQGIRRTARYRQFSTTGLTTALLERVDRLNVEQVRELATGLAKLLAERPVVERRHCEISQKYSWIIPVAARSVQRLIENRHPAALSQSTLAILLRIPLARSYDEYSTRNKENRLAELVPTWPELNHRLFWADVAVTRKWLFNKHGDRLTHVVSVSVGGRLWGFSGGDFERIKSDVTRKATLDDRLIALNLAYVLYRQNGRPRKWREQLKRAASSEAELQQALHRLLHPPKSPESSRANRRHAQWERRWKARGEREKRDHAGFVARVKESPDSLRETKFAKQKTVSTWQWHLHEAMRQASQNRKHRAGREWRLLIPEFGEAVAEAFRDGVTAYWRVLAPPLRSEGIDDPNTIPFSYIFGLTGLQIEASDDEGWAAKLTEDEAATAVRYIFWELNGFPDWLPSFYQHHRALVRTTVLTELDWELRQGGEDQHYVFSDIVYYTAWMWDDVADHVFSILREGVVSSPKYVDYCLRIILASVRTNEEISGLAQHRLSTDHEATLAAWWLALWVDTDADRGIPALTSFLQALGYEDASSFAQRFIVSLVGGDRGPGLSRGTYKTSDKLGELYRLMHLYIRYEDDIERAGKGVYSPGLRDHAQDARNQLISMLTSIPGKPTYRALQKLAEDHPNKASRPWMVYQAKKRAEGDADLAPWTPTQLRDYADALELTPVDHRQLFDLAVARLTDLKADLERGDSSDAPLLIKTGVIETDVRKYVGNWLRRTALGRYVPPQEEELADAKKPDLRFHGVGFDGPVPVELKLADNWTGSDLFERLSNQLCGDYLRDDRSRRGVFLVVAQGMKSAWHHPETHESMNFRLLTQRLQDHWDRIAGDYPGIDEVRVIGIDLGLRTKPRR